MEIITIIVFFVFIIVICIVAKDAVKHAKKSTLNNNS